MGKWVSGLVTFVVSILVLRVVVLQQILRNNVENKVIELIPKGAEELWADTAKFKFSTDGFQDGGMLLVRGSGHYLGSIWMNGNVLKSDAYCARYGSDYDSDIILSCIFRNSSLNCNWLSNCHSSDVVIEIHPDAKIVFIDPINVGDITLDYTDEVFGFMKKPTCPLRMYGRERDCFNFDTFFMRYDLEITRTLLFPFHFLFFGSVALVH